jgi:FkbM family methyltransferase
MIHDHLERLRNKGFHPSNILDIGANNGNFTRFCKYLWPLSRVHMIEANSECIPNLIQLNEPFYHQLLGSEDNRVINFYKTRVSNTCTGNSVYRENTCAYSDENLIVETKSLITLDTLFKDKNVRFDFAKLDTQGSELDIMKGGTKTLSTCKYILLEVSLKYYNEGIPLKDEVVNHMKDFGYEGFEVIEQHIWESPEKVKDIKNGEVFQEDIMFIKD